MDTPFAHAVKQHLMEQYAPEGLRGRRDSVRRITFRETTPHASPLKKVSFRAPPRTAEVKLVDGRVPAQLELGGITRQYAERLGIGPARRRTS